MLLVNPGRHDDRPDHWPGDLDADRGAAWLQTVVVAAVDPSGAGGTQAFTIAVNAVNHPPILDPIADQIGDRRASSSAIDVHGERPRRQRRLSTRSTPRPRA